MKLHQKLVAPVACALALVLWGCNSEQVESGAEATAKGLDKAGDAIENSRQQVGQEDRARRRRHQVGRSRRHHRPHA